jgi:uncharacterized protein
VAVIYIIYMKIHISGSSGYLGSVISEELKKNGHTVYAIGRRLLYEPAEQLANYLAGTDAVIHLAGAPIIRRWTEKNKKEIKDSRVVTAGNLAAAIALLKPESRPSKVISASGVSIFASGQFHTEESTSYDSGFLGQTVKELEQAWEKLPAGIELTIFRMAAVLGKNSPPIKKMYLPFIMGVGGKVGNGKQPFPFVHEADVARAYTWAVENSGTGGLFILAAPNRVNNAEFTDALGKALHRPALFTIPAAALKLIYGKSSEVLIHSPAVYPGRLLNKGFSFKYEDIEQTLKQIFDR